MKTGLRNSSIYFKLFKLKGFQHYKKLGLLGVLKLVMLIRIKVAILTLGVLTLVLHMLTLISMLK